MLWISCQFDALVLGESISVDGVCLTVVDSKPNGFACEVSPETMGLTIANEYTVGRIVNLERSMCLNDRVGGHLVTGHVDQSLFVEETQSYDGFIEVIFSAVGARNQSYLIEKGSVAVNGVSLTINKVHADGFCVMLIPHTLQRTNLSQLLLGRRVNVEYDQMAKLVNQQVRLYLEAKGTKHESLRNEVEAIHKSE